MIQVRPSDPTISFKMRKEDFRPKSRLQWQSIMQKGRHLMVL